MAGPENMNKKQFRAYQKRVTELKENLRTAQDAMNQAVQNVSDMLWADQNAGLIEPTKNKE